MKDSWTNYYGKNNNNYSNIYLNTNEFYNKYAPNVIGEQFSSKRDPPWYKMIIKADIVFAKQLSKEDPAPGSR